MCLRIRRIGVSGPATPNGLLNGCVFGSQRGSLSAHRTGILVNNRGADRRGPPENAALTTPRPSIAGGTGNLNYFFSAASCWFALLTAALTAARNESLPAGACTSPDSVLRKETFLP